jgi:hypothetical protein
MDNQVVVGFVDEAAGFLRSSNRSTGVGAAGYFLALEAASNANVASLVDALPSISATAASSSQYSLVSTTAVFNFITSTGSGIQVTVPAPAASMFGADGVTINAADPAAAGVIAAVIGYLTDGNGNTATAFTSGVKSSRRVEQVGS